ncbi:hypothetical protein DFO73_105236 [Cytobacillus oceanisediminis]|uniref:Uncharacterized protein n=1 Tax=Cytobacillus oceanisediminis TaxID=665099 RepID=A0A2V2ZWZ6_9BACI|nr:hypothetical protein DFO73_105236 [Cytobacillus oceanisediminis]
MSWREYDRFGNQKFIRVSNRRQDVSFDFHNDSYEEFESPSEVQAQTGRKRDKHRSRSAVRGLSPSACQKLADIIGGDVAVTEPARIVQRLRDIDAKYWTAPPVPLLHFLSHFHLKIAAAQILLTWVKLSSFKKRLIRSYQS